MKKMAKEKLGKGTVHSRDDRHFFLSIVNGVGFYYFLKPCKVTSTTCSCLPELNVLLWSSIGAKHRPSAGKSSSILLIVFAGLCYR